MISPTVGRVVWFWPSPQDLEQGGMSQHDPHQPFEARVACVWGDRCVNLAVTDHAGQAHRRTSVQLLQDDDQPNPGSNYAEWMPYQKGQAAKHEAPAA